MAQLTEDTFEPLLRLAQETVSIDLRQSAFIDPYGMVGLLEIGEFLKRGGARRALRLPDEEVLSYLERMDFFRFAGEYFEFASGQPPMQARFPRSPDSDVLLEITSIAKSDDIHYIVGKVKDRAHAILEKHLHYDERGINGFIVALSEVCQNVIEHSENRGFVGIQKYYWKTIEKNVVKIAVMDIGVGFRKSLSERFSFRSDFEAIGKGLLHGASRYSDKGRGHGLSALRRFVNEWNGRLSVRSGTAKLSIIPNWSGGKRKEENLAYFPGAQINIILPEV
jgi:anti-sigma regulatory factor (Ser/Thr protein kinase)